MILPILFEETGGAAATFFDTSWVSSVVDAIEDVLGVLSTPPLPMFIGLTFLGVAFSMILRIVKR